MLQQAVFASAAAAESGVPERDAQGFSSLYCGMNINHLRCSAFLQQGRSCVQSKSF